MAKLRIRSAATCQYISSVCPENLYLKKKGIFIWRKRFAQRMDDNSVWVHSSRTNTKFSQESECWGFVLAWILSSGERHMPYSVAISRKEGGANRDRLVPRNMQCQHSQMSTCALDEGKLKWRHVTRQLQGWVASQSQRQEMCVCVCEREREREREERHMSQRKGWIRSWLA